MQKGYICKKVTSVLLVTALLLSACGNEEKKDEKVASGSAVSEGAAEVTPEPTEEPVDESNLIENGTFDDKNKSWPVYRQSGGNGSTSVVDGEMEVDISDVGEVQHGVQIFYEGFKLDQKAEYSFSFDARSTVEREVDLRFQINGGDYHAYFEKPVKLTKDMKSYEYSFTMEEPSDPAPRLVFNCGYGSEADKSVGEHQLYFDNFRLEVKDDSNVVAAEEDDPTGIRVNQVGYQTNDIKTAVFADVSTDSDDFSVVNANTGKEEFTGTLEAAVNNVYAGETDRVADFSGLTKPGKYKVKAGDGTESPVFEIGDKVYQNIFKKLIKMLYMQRCGTKLEKKYAGKHAHKKCHTHKALVYGEDTYIDVSGGWHDAGDYGRYVVAGAKAVADLLWAHELYGKTIDDVGTPDSGNGIDDILEEAKYELDWMLKMQSPRGSVYHKVTCKNFPSTIMPEKETEELVVTDTSTPATGDFAAVMAMASRVYGKTKNKSFKKAAKKYLKAAKKAWKFLETHPKVNGFTNPSDIVTGEYPDTVDKDERFWAAVELSAATDDRKYEKYIEKYSDDADALRGLGWQQIGLYGVFATSNSLNLFARSDSLLKNIYDNYTKDVTDAASGAKANPYAVNRADEYEWGSNMGIANDGIMFMMTNKTAFAGDDNSDLAKRQLSYLLGENPTGYCFVTGFGEKSPKHPHHRPSQAKGKAVPGMLVGGPDNALEDPYAQAVLTEKPPAKCYSDSDQSYSTNEVTIYWNSPMILLLAGLMSK